MELREKIAQYAYEYGGSWSRISTALRNQQSVKKRIINENYITVFDREYPESLKMLRYPPWILFYSGDITLLNRPAVTIIGSRRASSYGKMVTENCVSILGEKFSLVSGLAKGIDSVVHNTAIKYGYPTIGIIGCGLDTCYPEENRKLYNEMKEKHLILSEYPRYVGVKKEHFPWRNRILAALGRYIIVTQAQIKSGTMCTVNEANNLGKEIWVCPYPYNEDLGEGCNLLISQGANILYSMELLRDLRIN